MLLNIKSRTNSRTCLKRLKRLISQRSKTKGPQNQHINHPARYLFLFTLMKILLSILRNENAFTVKYLKTLNIGKVLLLYTHKARKRIAKEKIRKCNFLKICVLVALRKKYT